jgi:hypothetical protein
MADMIVRFTIEAGALVRSRIKSEIKSYCFTEGLTCEVEEDKGLLESTYYFKVAGRIEKSQAIYALAHYVKRIEVIYD